MQETVPASKRRVGGWAIPASVLLHLLVVGAFFFQLPERMAEPQEPESISVDLVPPPEEPKAEEEKKPEEPKPPAEEQAKENPPPPPPAPTPPAPAMQPSIAVRPEMTQLDPVDKPGKTEEKEKTSTAEETDTAGGEPDSQPEPTAKQQDTAAQEAEESNLAAQADDGEIVASLTPNEAAPPDKPPVPQPKPAEEKPAAEAAKGNSDALPAAESLLSSAMLTRDQRRQIFGELPPRRRIVQLCRSEAIAQVQNAGFPIEGIVAYSDTGGLISGNKLDATGGAFNVGSKWHDISFQCEVDMDNYAVTAFRFKIGNELSEPDAKKRGFATLR